MADGIRLLAGDVVESTSITVNPPTYWIVVRRTVNGVEERIVKSCPIAELLRG